MWCSEDGSGVGQGRRVVSLEEFSKIISMEAVRLHYKTLSGIVHAMKSNCKVVLNLGSCDIPFV